ncbi:MAG: hypothetical protein Q9159_001461 [Coniocarpon cinnabarinum]
MYFFILSRVMLLLLVFGLVAGFTTAAIHDDLTALIPSFKTRHGDGVISKAFGVLAEMEHAPSCNRLAMTVLIDSCKTLQPDKSTNNALDLVKSAFAARLAVCEHLGAGGDIPDKSKTDRDRSERSFTCRVRGARCSQAREDAVTKASEYSDINQRQVSDCTKALNSQDKWWMSYSNAIQNAISVCHAARAEVEREEVLNVHQSMTEVVSDLSSVLGQRLRDSEQQAADDKQSATNMRELQKSLASDMASSAQSARAYLASLITEAEHRLSSIFSSTFSSLEKANQNIEKVSTMASESSSDVENARKKLSAMMQDASRDAGAITEAQGKITDSLDMVQQQDLKNIFVAFAQLQTELRASSQLMVMMADRQSEHDQWLHGLDGALETLTKSTMILKELQEAQAANQNEIIGAVNNKIEALGTAIVEKTQAVHAINILGDLYNVGRFIAAGVGVMAVVGVGLAGFFAIGYLLVTADPLRRWVEKMRSVPVAPASWPAAPGTMGWVLAGGCLVAGVVGLALRVQGRSPRSTSRKAKFEL